MFVWDDVIKSVTLTLLYLSLVWMNGSVVKDKRDVLYDDVGYVYVWESRVKHSAFVSTRYHWLHYMMNTNSKFQPHLPGLCTLSVSLWNVNDLVVNRRLVFTYEGYIWMKDWASEKEKIMEKRKEKKRKCKSHFFDCSRVQILYFFSLQQDVKWEWQKNGM